jgi:hypothetical protein
MFDGYLLLSLFKVKAFVISYKISKNYSRSYRILSMLLVKT